MATVKMKLNGVEKYLLNGEITYSWKNFVSNNPISGGFSLSTPVFEGWENPGINLSFHLPDKEDSWYTENSIVNWSDWLDYVTNQDIETAATKLYLVSTYGKNSKILLSSTGGSTGIPIIVKGFSMRIAPEDSKDAGHMLINAQLIETTDI